MSKKIILISISGFLLFSNLAIARVFSPSGLGDLFSTNLADEMTNQIDYRVSGLSTSTGNTKLYSTRATSTGSWVRNTSAWTTRGSSTLDFSGQSPWNSTGGYTRSGTLISPRHIILAEHYQISIGATIIFVDSSNNIITRTLANRATIPVGGTDIAIGLLNADVPESIAYYPMLSVEQITNYFSRDTDIPMVMLDQDDDLIIRDFFAYPNNFDFLQCISSYNGVCQTSMYMVVFGESPATSTRHLFYQPLIDGDSGNPVFFVINNQLVLMSHHTLPGGGPNYSRYINEINSTMASLQGGSDPYQVSTYDLSDFISHVDPVLSYSVGSSLPEHSVVSTHVGTVSATTTPLDLTKSYSIVSGNTNNVFSINSSTGEITVANREFLDYETNPAFNLVVRVDDNWGIQGFSTTSISISLQNVENDIGFNNLDYNFSVYEQIPIGTSIGFVSASSSLTDPNIVYSIISGNTNNVFSINSSTGEIITAADLDYESISSYSLTIKAVNNPVSVDIAVTSVTININNITPFSTSDEWFYGRQVYRDWRVQGYAWGENVGWIKISPNSSTSAYLGDIGMTGYMYGESTGWVSLSCRNTNTCDDVNYGVLNDGSGNLSGFAWGENVGWVHFGSSTSPYKVAVDQNGKFSGFAYSESVGYINFNTGDYSATTTWRYSSSRKQCDDGVDNDNDRKIDYPNDPNCSSLVDDREAPASRSSVVNNETSITGGTISVTPVVVSILTSPSNVNNIIPSTQPLNPPLVNVPQTSPAKKVFNFNKDIEMGNRGGDVIELQKLLIEKGYFLSAGVTGFFGEQTKKALTDFQLANGIKPATGYFGPKTRNIILGNTKEIVKSQSDSRYNFTRNLKLNSIGEDVRQLQIYLNNKGFVISDSGLGSKGKETNLYGQKTLDAVRRYQEYYKDEILTPSNLKKGTGLFLESTRRHVNNN